MTGLTGGIEHLFKKYKVDYKKGKGKITGANSVEVTGETNETLATKNIVIATGSEPSKLPMATVDNAGGKIVDSTGALDIKEVPKRMAVIGGGVIGLEMGSVWKRLGSEVRASRGRRRLSRPRALRPSLSPSLTRVAARRVQVTVIEYLDRILPGGDKEIGSSFQRILKKQGFKFKLSTGVQSSEVTASGVTLNVASAKGGKEESLEFDVVLVATGARTPAPLFAPPLFALPPLSLVLAISSSDPINAPSRARFSRRPQALHRRPRPRGNGHRDRQARPRGRRFAL